MLGSLSVPDAHDHYVNQRDSYSHLCKLADPEETEARAVVLPQNDDHLVDVASDPGGKASDHS